MKMDVSLIMNITSIFSSVISDYLMGLHPYR